MIGLSLSLCLRDIASGKVDRTDVDRLIIGTCMSTSHLEELVFDGYMKTYWKPFPEEQMKELFKWARVIWEQPRITQNKIPCIASGHWVLGYDEIEWV